MSVVITDSDPPIASLRVLYEVDVMELQPASRMPTRHPAVERNRLFTAITFSINFRGVDHRLQLRTE
jgi:hypothetical protein